MNTVINLPRGWANTNFEELVSSLPHSMKRGPFGSAIKKSFFVPQGYKVYEQQNAINDDAFIGHYYINEDKYQELQNFKVAGGDFLISCSGTIGRITRLPENCKAGIINQALLKITLEENLIYPAYFLLLFRSHNFQSMVLQDTRGSGMKNLASVKDIKKLKVCLPPFNEQKRIVAKIEELFSELDKGVETLKRAQEQLKIYRQSILKHAFEGKLTPKWRERNGRPFNWQTKTIKELTVINPKHKDVDDECKISFVPMGALNQETALIDEHEYRKFGEVKKGYTHFADNDVLFAKITPCMENGKNGIAKDLKNGLACGSTEFFVFRCHDGLLPEYLLLKFRDTLFRRLAEANMTGAVGQRRVPKNWIEKVEINLPPVDEQRKIVDEISILNDEIYHIEKDISDNLKRADVLRQAILKKAFSGKLVDQDPNDEPASVLLERIAQEKQQAKPAKRTKKKVSSA